MTLEWASQIKLPSFFNFFHCSLKGSFARGTARPISIYKSPDGPPALPFFKNHGIFPAEKIGTVARASFDRDSPGRTSHAAVVQRQYPAGSAGRHARCCRRGCQSRPAGVGIGMDLYRVATAEKRQKNGCNPFKVHPSIFYNVLVFFLMNATGEVRGSIIFISAIRRSSLKNSAGNPGGIRAAPARLLGSIHDGRCRRADSLPDTGDAPRFPANFARQNL